MDREDQLLVTLTIGQFKELTKTLVSEEVKQALIEYHKLNDISRDESRVCNIDQACQITKLKKATLYSKVSLGEIPYLSRRKPLLFDRDQLEMWIRASRPKTDSIDEIKKILEAKRK